jgi:hypothetical protein
MTKLLGPNFSAELRTAGLVGLPIVWADTDDSITGRENLTAAQNTALDAVIAAHDATKSKVPQTVSRRQMLLGLALAGYITSDEAVAAASTGAVPAAVQSFFSTLPAEQQPAAKITWAAMSECQRDNALVTGLAAAHNLTPAQTDDLFRSWANL